MDYKFLDCKKDDGIFTIKICKEKTLNALNTELMAEIDSIFTEILEMDDVEVVIITGSGKAFVAGADISHMANIDTKEAFAFAKAGTTAFAKIERLNKPVIAAINGFALGGGCELALSCDIRIASLNAKLGLPEVSLGIIPGFGGTQRLPRTVGISKAKELIYTGEFISAEEALKIGLISQVVEPEELMDKALEIAAKIIKNSKLAVRYAKEAINTGLQADIATGMNIESANFALCFATEDQKEGMTSFLNKKAPKFSGQ
ncbi:MULTISPECIES: enoyl-CoA hydratase-related protein [Peptoniphilus]|uniref:enoyl-CoA hydratase-related protein n=1 Tax=Peptoniphilus TaxID=162289 RepID=UPI0001DA99C9|nr:MULTISPECIES: enoyl-CoA hydratase-related protein [Peptoniphilus]EFI41763.1 3-hydroxybutyryl-CoA dehydratase [Peptoniphilus sp. oral taxon 386 str. F0131]